MTDYSLDELKWLAEFAGVPWLPYGSLDPNWSVQENESVTPTLCYKGYGVAPLNSDPGLRLLSTLVLDAERWREAKLEVANAWDDALYYGCEVGKADRGGDESYAITDEYLQAHHAILRAALTLREG